MTAETTQNYGRWFTDWPAGHERAGETVEVMAVELHVAEMEASRRQVSALERKLAWTNGKMRAIDALLYPLVQESQAQEVGFDPVRRAWAIARENS